MSLENTYVIGMDMGTTNIKAAVLGNDGRIAAEASLPNKFYNPGANMHEQDADEWWQNVQYIFNTITERMGRDEARRISGICISSHTVSLLPIDKKGTPLYRALTYQDGRSAGELREIIEKTGYGQFVRTVGGQPSVAFLPNKILWFKRHEPERFQKTKYFMQASSYINYKLTGVMTSDIDQGLRTQCMDIETLEWSDLIGNVIGVDLKEFLPPIKLINEVIGYVTPEAAKATGLVPGIPVLAGCSDAMAAMYATGMSRLGECGESSGTTSLVFVGSNVKSPSDVPVVTRPCAIEGMPWVFDAPIQSSGASIRWFIDKFAKEEAEAAALQGKNIYEYLNELAYTAKPGSNGLLFFPYLLGERAPLWNDHARGMFIGMRMDMGRNELTRSVFEGTAFALRHVMETVKREGAKAELLRICGGGAKSRVWNQIKAAVLNMPVHVLSPESGDVPVGDAMIAGHKVGMFENLTETAEKIIKVQEIIEPDPEWVKAYDELYPYYVSMYQHLDADLKNMQTTLENFDKTKACL